MRKLRAAREDPAAARATGIDIHRERLWSFALSGALSGFAGGLLVHLAGTLQARDVYLDLTFLTLAMLVVGGVGSLWGAVVGALAVSALDTFLLKAESGEIGFVDDMLGKPLWGGSRLVGVAAFMAIVLVFLPNGLTRGREFRLPRFGQVAIRRGAWSMNTRVCVIGAGTIGGIFAGHLAQVADVSILTRRGAHADALNEQGLRITGRSDLEAPVFASADPARLPPFDLGIVACKGTDLDAVASALEGRYQEATLMTVQNGLGAEEIVRRRGTWQLVSAITFMSGTRHSDTEVEYVLDTPTWLGPYEDTPFERVEEVTALIPPQA